MEEDLDLSWIEDEESLLRGSQYKKTPMSEICIRFIYVGSTQEIAFRSKHTFPLNVLENRSEISNACLLRIIKSHQTVEGKKYKLGDMMLYNVNIEPENLQAFSQGLISTGFSTVSMFESVIIEPSLPCFHTMNEIYIVYRETLMSNVDTPSRSIVKRGAGATTAKRVRIVEHGGVSSKTGVRKTQCRKPSVG